MTPKNEREAKKVKWREEKVRMVEEEVGKVKKIIQELNEREEQIQKCSDVYDKKIEKLKKEKREALERTKNNFNSPEKLLGEYFILHCYETKVRIFSKKIRCNEGTNVDVDSKEDVLEKLRKLGDYIIILCSGVYLSKNEFLNKLSKLNESQLD